MLAFRAEEYSRVDDALREIISKVRLRRTVEVLLAKKAYGRVSAFDVVSPVDVPASATSHMDGFAVITEDLQRATNGAPVALRISGEVKLGVPATLSIRHGEAVRVATGAGVPAKADAVIPAEFTRLRKDKVFISSRPVPGSHVYRGGEDVRRGETVLAKGQVVRAQDIGLLLAVGLTRVRVWEKPRVSLLATGDELTDATRPKAGKIRNSHSPVFLRLLEAQGCVPVYRGIIRDDWKEVAKAIRRALVDSDFVLTLGGTSAGKRDVVGGAISRLHPEVMIHGIAMDRGRVTGIAVVNGKPVLMMPGPIQGAMNAFLLLGIPLVEMLSGRKRTGLGIRCQLGKAWSARERFSDFRKVVYVKLSKRGQTVAEPLAGETESIKVLADAEGYIVVPEEVRQLESGSRVQVRLLPGFSPV